MSSAPPGNNTTSTPGASSAPQQPGTSSVSAPTNAPDQTTTGAPLGATSPGPITQGFVQDPNTQPMMQQQGGQLQMQGQPTYPPGLTQPGGFSPTQQQQQWYPPPQSPSQQPAPLYQGQYQQPPPQGPPVGYNQFPPTQSQQNFPQMPQLQGYPMQQQQNYSQYPPQQAGWMQQPPPQQNPQGYNYGQGGYGFYQPQGVQAPYNMSGASGYPPPTGQYPQAFPPVGPVTAGLFPTSSLPYIPPTVGYNPGMYEEASPLTYPAPDCIADVDLIVKAFSSRLNTDEGALIQVLSKRSHPLEIASRKKAYNFKFSNSKSKELLDIVNNRTWDFSGGFKSITHALVAGPLELDVFLLRKAIKGAGTIEKYLDMVLLCRSNEDIKAISQRYREVSSSSRTLLQAIEGDLSGDIFALYKAVLLAERYYDDPTVPIPKEELERNIKTLFAALTGRVDVNTVISFFIHGSFHRLASISKEWKNVTNQKSLELYISEKFNGHMEDALLYILLSAKDRTLAQATTLDKSLRSSSGPLGHKDEEIAVQVAKLVWEDQLRVGSAKPSGGVYAHGDFLKEVDSKYRERQALKDSSAYLKKTALLSKIRSETTGDFQKFLVGLWEKQRD